MARLNAMKVILNAVAYAPINHRLDLQPDPSIVVSGTRELELMRMQLRQLGRFTD
jgi:hypothetical protein